MEDETNWQRQVLIGLVVLVAVGALIGGIVAVVSIKAADIAGIDDTTPSKDAHGGPLRRASDPPPSESTTGAAPTGPTTPSSTSSGAPPTKQPPEEDNGIELQASPQNVSTYERINLTGDYKAPSGTVLEVQRKEAGSWSAFADVTATVNGGHFATYVETGQSGMNLFRVVALGRDETSNPVRVQVS
jgi:hypothetical protein